MNSTTLGTVVRRLQSIGETALPSDRQLLADFFGRQDQSAFTAIVRRHGPMVQGVLRRALRHEQDVEDAFQATFLVLARSAGSIRDVQALPSWLHGVSRRIAMKTKRSAARRRNHEGRVVPAPNSSSDLDWREVQSVLDEEVGRLAAIYRTPFILCCLEGIGREEASQRLGLKEGTLSSRLAKARTILKDRLSTRGITLSAVLASIALNGDHVVAKPLEKAAVHTFFGKASAAVLALARGMTPTIAYSRIKFVGAVLVVAAMCAGAGALKARPTAPANVPVVPLNVEPDADDGAVVFAEPPTKPEAPAEFDVAGTIVGPDTKPVPNAIVLLWTSNLKKRDDAQVKTTTGPDGKYSLRVPGSALEHDAMIVATAKGFGADWIDLRRPPKGPVSLCLPKDDLPVAGRIIDLEGKPIANANIAVTGVERLRSGDLTVYIDAFKKADKYTFPSFPPTIWIAPAALDVPVAATTDKDGKFQLPGFGRERLVQLTVHAEGAERRMLTALTRPDDPEMARKTFMQGVPFEVTLGPGKVITGTVTERLSGKPVAGVRIHAGQTIATSDAKGVYRLDGVTKQKTHYVGVAAPRPYFYPEMQHIDDTPGLEPITVNVQLDRGIEITGQLRDKVTGKPITGVVWYNAKSGNLKIKEQQIAASGVGGRFETKADGTFKAVAVPGPGYLTVQADENRFIRAPLPDWDGSPIDAVPHGIIPQQFHVVASIDPDPTKPDSLAVTIELEEGLRKSGTVVDPDGKPVEGAIAFGLTSIPDPGATTTPRPQRFGPPPSGRLKDASFTAVGLNPKEPRLLVFVHPEKKLGKIFEVRGDEEGDLIVKLDPLCSATGRVVNADGSGATGLFINTVPPRRIADYKRLPMTLLNTGPINYLSRSEQSKWLPAAVAVDNDGKFQIDGLLPGINYDIWVTAERIEPRKPPQTLQMLKATFEKGKTTDLGEIKLKATE